MGGGENRGWGEKVKSQSVGVIYMNHGIHQTHTFTLVCIPLKKKTIIKGNTTKKIQSKIYTFEGGGIRVVSIHLVVAVQLTVLGLRLATQSGANLK